MMESIYLLKHEQVNYKNYPELRVYRKEINEIIKFASEVNKKLERYHAGIVDKIDVIQPDLEEYIIRCRNLLDVLGNSEKPCIDIIIPIRDFLRTLYELLYLKKSGSDFIGTPTTTIEGSEV